MSDSKKLMAWQRPSLVRSLGLGPSNEIGFSATKKCHTILHELGESEQFFVVEAVICN